MIKIIAALVKRTQTITHAAEELQCPPDDGKRKKYQLEYQFNHIIYCFLFFETSHRSNDQMQTFSLLADVLIKYPVQNHKQ